MKKDRALRELVDNPVSRRSFAKSAVATGLWATGVGLFDGQSAEVLAASVTDVDILNFALNLEYLEAEFYTVATTGQRIADIGIEVTGKGRPGATVGGAAVALDARTGTVAAQLALDEQKHVVFLRTALGSKAVAKPSINLEALGLGFRNQAEFVTLARAFEDVGVSAYGGAAPLIKSSQILAAAARIALTEAQHAGSIRLVISDLMVAVPQVDPFDVPPLGSPAGRLYQVDGQGLSTVRTPSQVLSIVYASTSSGTSRGGFYPDGFNGTVHTV